MLYFLTNIFLSLTRFPIKTKYLVYYGNFVYESLAFFREEVLLAERFLTIYLVKCNMIGRTI